MAALSNNIIDRLLGKHDHWGRLIVTVVHHNTWKKHLKLNY